MAPAVKELLRDIESPNARSRLAASKAIRDLAQHSPESVYPHFDQFASLLTSDNTILKWNAILTLAYVAPVDRDGKLDRVLTRYLAPIRGPVMITAANTIKGAALIARAKPKLAGKITSAILRVDKAKYATPECRNVAIGHAVQALSAIQADTLAIRSFAAREATNPRPATAKKAARLLASLELASKSRIRS